MLKQTITILSTILTFSLITPLSADDMTIVENGKSTSVIVLPSNTSEHLAEAAKEFQKCIREASGATMDIVENTNDGNPAIHIGKTDFVKSLNLDLSDLKNDGFVIRHEGAEHLVIIGPTQTGTAFGVYRFLEDFLDVRWLMPTDIGRSVPKKETISVPINTAIRESPAFTSRRLGLRNKQLKVWAQRNGMRSSIRFHHNLRNLYKPAVFAEEHPEFYPLIKGQRFNPLDSDKRWQPCLTAPGIVEAGVERINEYFRNNPEQNTYSLGINDTLRFCECEDCRKLDSGRKNSTGYKHLSDRYFTWANEVVDKVLEEHPDKYFGTLAYLNIAAPPDNVNVHPRIIPYLTSDRMRWAVPEIAAEEKRLTREWQEQVTPLAWYDYIYGAAYCVPRVYPHLQAEYLRWGYNHDVRHLYAEAHPYFGEGPKLYTWLKLVWDPKQDVDKILNEWYRRCVGEKAAPALKAYYEHWERFWTERVPKTAWFSEKGHFLRFYDPGYLEAVTEKDIDKSRAWLEKTVARAETEKQRKRAELLLKSFEYYEASALAYPKNKRSVNARNPGEAVNTLEKRMDRAEMAHKRLELADNFGDNPLLNISRAVQKYDALQGSQWDQKQLLPLFDWVRRSQKVRNRLEGLTANRQDKKIRQTTDLLKKLAEASEQDSIIKNASFESGNNWAVGWTLWNRHGIGRMYKTDRTSHSGDASICFEGVEHGAVNRSKAYKPGKYAAYCFISLPPEQRHNGTVELALIPKNKHGANLFKGKLSTKIIPTVPTTNWQPLVVSGRIPPVIDRQEVASIALYVIVDGLQQKEKIYIDDLKLFRLKSDND